MDPLAIPLALRCILTFMTDEDGRTPDGIYYQTVALTDAQGHQRVLEPAVAGKGFSPGTLFRAGRSPDGLFASYAVLERAAGHNVGDVRFVSAKTCGPIRFVLVRNGVTVNALEYEGWMKNSPHGVRVLQDALEDGLALPIDEAKLANPGIQE